jgi:hypothetical protein
LNRGKIPENYYVNPRKENIEIQDSQVELLQVKNAGVIP